LGTAIIDLNDSAIQIRHGQLSVTAPGYALLTSEGIKTGKEAMEEAWLYPQQSNNRYWHQLNLSPLSGANNHARHHADLAYAQLQALYQHAEKPEQIIFAIPGSISSDQLSILLGLVKSSPFRAVGLVDAAVAATCGANVKGEVIHVDIQLHGSVLTRMNCGETISRLYVSQHPEISLKGYFDNWAKFIAERFIAEFRYDPTHTAAGEQQLRDSLPAWLLQLRNNEEIEIELAAKQGNFRLNVLRNELVAANSQRWQRLADVIAREKQANALLISHRIDLLPGAKDYLAYTDVLSADAAIVACLANIENFQPENDKLSFVTSLPVVSATDTQTPASSSASSNTLGILPDHVLYRNQAHAIGDQLTITHDEGGLIFSNHNVSDAPHKSDGIEGQLVIRLEADNVQLDNGQSNLSVKCHGDPSKLKPGDKIIVQDEVLKLIEVL
jgi:hypothetical protein